MRKQKIALLVATIVSMLGITIGFATPAVAADPAPCTNWSGWFNNGTNWGQWRWCRTPTTTGGFPSYWYRYQVDDTLTDGYAVHLEMCADQQGYPCTHGSQAWAHGDILNPGCIESVGPVATSGWFGSLQITAGNTHTDMRLVKGSCSGTHQNAGSAWIHFTS